MITITDVLRFLIVYYLSSGIMLILNPQGTIQLFNLQLEPLGSLFDFILRYCGLFCLGITFHLMAVTQMKDLETKKKVLQYHLFMECGMLYMGYHGRDLLTGIPIGPIVHAGVSVAIMMVCYGPGSYNKEAKMM